MNHLHLDIGEARRRGSDSIGAHPHLRDEQMKKLLQKSSMDKVDWMAGSRLEGSRRVVGIWKSHLGKWKMALVRNHEGIASGIEKKPCRDEHW